MTPAWRVAAALALACNLDWGRWAAGWTAQCTCEPYRGHDGKGSRLYHSDRCISDAAMDERGITDSARHPYVEHRATPVPNPSDAAAYLADCARRGVEPGPLPLPSLECWDAQTGVFFRVSASSVRIDVGGACWATITFDGAVRVTTNDDGCEADNIALLSTLITAAAAALEHDHG